MTLRNATHTKKQELLHRSYKMPHKKGSKKP